MTRLGGWQRLWVLIGVLWAVPILALTWNEPSATLLFWAVPMAVLYATGRSIGWVVEGFRQPTTDVQRTNDDVPRPRASGQPQQRGNTDTPSNGSPSRPKPPPRERVPGVGSVDDRAPRDVDVGEKGWRNLDNWAPHAWVGFVVTNALLWTGAGLCFALLFPVVGAAATWLTEPIARVLSIYLGNTVLGDSEGIVTAHRVGAVLAYGLTGSPLVIVGQFTVFGVWHAYLRVLDSLLPPEAVKWLSVRDKFATDYPSGITDVLTVMFVLAAISGVLVLTVCLAIDVWSPLLAIDSQSP